MGGSCNACMCQDTIIALVRERAGFCWWMRLPPRILCPSVCLPHSTCLKSTHRHVASVGAPSRPPMFAPVLPACPAVCLPGYGGPSCAECTVGAWSAGGNASTPAPACEACPTGKTTVAARIRSSTSCSGDCARSLDRTPPALPSKHACTTKAPGQLHCMLLPCTAVLIDTCITRVPTHHPNHASVHCWVDCARVHCAGLLKGGQFMSNGACASCPLGTSTMSTGAVSQNECSCKTSQRTAVPS